MCVVDLTSCASVKHNRHSDAVEHKKYYWWTRCDWKMLQCVREAVRCKISTFAGTCVINHHIVHKIEQQLQKNPRDGIHNSVVRPWTTYRQILNRCIFLWAPTFFAASVIYTWFCFLTSNILFISRRKTSHFHSRKRWQCVSCDVDSWTRSSSSLCVDCAFWHAPAGTLFVWFWKYTYAYWM